MAQQVDDDFGDVVRRDLPVGAFRLVAARESGRHRTGHHVADADVVVPNFLHQRFAERVQARLRGAVGGRARKGVLPGQAADVDDEAAAAPAQVRKAAWQR